MTVPAALITYNTYCKHTHTHIQKNMLISAKTKERHAYKSGEICASRRVLAAMAWWWEFIFRSKRKERPAHETTQYDVLRQPFYIGDEPQPSSNIRSLSKGFHIIEEQQQPTADESQSLKKKDKGYY